MGLMIYRFKYSLLINSFHWRHVVDALMCLTFKQFHIRCSGNFYLMRYAWLLLFSFESHGLLIESLLPILLL